MESYKQLNFELTLKNQELREVIQSYKVDNNNLNSLLQQQTEKKIKLQQTVAGFIDTISAHLNNILEVLFNSDCNVSNNIINNSYVSEVNNSHTSALQKRKNKTTTCKLSNSYSPVRNDDIENLSDFQFIENSINCSTSENKTKNNNCSSNLNNSTINEASNYIMPDDSIVSDEEIDSMSDGANSYANDNSNSLQLLPKTNLKYNLELNTIIEVSTLEESSMCIDDQITSTPFNKNKIKSPKYSTLPKQPPYIVLKRIDFNLSDNSEVINDSSKKKRNISNKENIDKQRPRRSAQPKSLAEPKLNTKLRRF